MTQIEFAAAFLAAQKEFPPIAKTKTADMGNYQYKFADLGDVLAEALPILHKNGLSLSQPLVSADGRVGVGTRLYHESGHVEEFGELLLSAGNTPQTAGSALTYARRYAACAALGIVADEDDAGRSASRLVIPEVDLTDLIRMKVAEFTDWTEDERREVWTAHAEKELGGKPTSPAEVEKVIASMKTQYDEGP